ncbi:nucleotide sugar dehydrogenase [Mucilaginibacter myungsuensis]|uniref:Nucleotide sugar dehydrogenase n=1 Tax=Mucilaginibacter myungsuensis TaxID=649104 RepID=A0A929KWV2_9SPHI|nr:nucleotide sugar dehydrogenase [Mucilaginibacter myungsuensis]MBE9662652.1 nucleotide sugar dehydrogenase [Mucilaginibacter myungsuensis]MDN3598072.1 nucleotide sugar dehydrogenase [Mucilaginibacter myungsuensis]
MSVQAASATSTIFNAPKHTSIAVIGLGYIGLPLAVEFAKQTKVKGFDIKESRLDELTQGYDRTQETDAADLRQALHNGLSFTSDTADIANCNIYIVAVPTPTDKHNRPDLALLKKASTTVGTVLKQGDVVIYESTVYPGATEEVCVPILEQVSGLRFNHDFFAGYSPERINPGDRVHTLTNILKVTSGSTPEVAAFIDDLYRLIVTAGTHKAPSIKVAEACKVIENSQRDINIAFVNELAKIFNIMGIDTHAVLEAAGTKWNFLKFKPGLVGGHCTGVDPYYLAQKAQEVGYHPEIILAGRRLNDGMGTYVAQEVIKLMIRKDVPVKGADILILGFTFKENCPDVRNTRVIDIVNVLADYDTNYRIYDPWADPAEVELEYGIQTTRDAEVLKNRYDTIVIAVAHREFLAVDLTALKKDPRSVIYDLKRILAPGLADGYL